jgi:hypothetical protein
VIDVVPYRPVHNYLIRVQDAQLAEVSLVPEGYASLYSPVGPAMTALDGSTVLLCGGIVPLLPGTGVIWALVARDAGPRMLALTRGIQRFLETQKLRRIEATTAEGFRSGCRWLEMLGFEFEGRMRGYGPAGETHLRYALVRT